jgi:diacylglycerol O-acyltransferase
VEGFNEVLALAGDPPPQAVPASFAAESSGPATRSVSGR